MSVMFMDRVYIEPSLCPVCKRPIDALRRGQTVEGGPIEPTTIEPCGHGLGHHSLRIKKQCSRELEDLQKRINQSNEQFRREESHLQAVAVCVAGGKLMYGELDLTVPDSRVTSFGNPDAVEFLPRLGEWRIEAEGFVEPTMEVLPVWFGTEVDWQPLRGKGYVTRVEPRPITGDYITTLHSNGELAYEGKPCPH